MAARIRAALVPIIAALTLAFCAYAQLRPEVTVKPKPKKPPAVKVTPKPAEKPAAKPEQPQKPPEPEPAQIIVETSPNAEVYLDDEFKGRASPEGRLVASGLKAKSYKLRISLAGKQDYVQQVEAVAGGVVEIKAVLADLPGKLVVRTLAGAEVFVDGSSRGMAGANGELMADNITAGSHELRVSGRGRKDFRQNVAVLAGQESTLEVRLEDLAPTPVRRGVSVAFQEPEMVPIPAGEFLMGWAKGEKDEKPVHRVYLTQFHIAKFVVTNAEYKQFIDATGYRPPVHWQGVKSDYTLWAGTSVPPEIARQPVINVSWDDAVAYCGWLRQVTGKPYRLPTEAEWEKAARGGLEQKLYPWGDEPPDHTKAWFGMQWIGTQTLRDVDQGIPNGHELYGMAGNVMQWVADWYDEKYYKKSPPRDPPGPGQGLERTVRGGAWQLDAGRCAERHHSDPHMRGATIGIRVARQ